MRIKIIQINKTTEAYLKQGVEVFISRIKNYSPIEEVTIELPKKMNSYPKELLMDAEGKKIMQLLTDRDWVVNLEVEGTILSSEKLAENLMKWQNNGRQNLCFVIGGAYGLSKEVKQRADFNLSFSKMTFSHQMIRLLLAEQIYRAYAIINNEPYHHA